MNVILLAMYILLSTGGTTLVKAGGHKTFESLFKIPYFNFQVSWVTFCGIIAYGISFLIFIVLLNKLNLSYLTPIATGLSYAILIGVSSVVFNESFTFTKAIGCVLILAGILLVVTSGTSPA
jgi:multidrug transporter EmrE-like cation transporter